MSQQTQPRGGIRMISLDPKRGFSALAWAFLGLVFRWDSGTVFDGRLLFTFSSYCTLWHLILVKCAAAVLVTAMVLSRGNSMHPSAILRKPIDPARGPKFQRHGCEITVSPRRKSLVVLVEHICFSRYSRDASRAMLVFRHLSLL